MPNFKPKANKKIKVKKNANVTLDSKHNEKMAEFTNIDTQKIPQLKETKKLLKKKLKVVTNIEDKLEIQDQINDIRKKISELKKQKKEYLLENSGIIFEYFEKKEENVRRNRYK